VLLFAVGIVSFGTGRADAKKQTLLALEIAPTYERAQELLLKLVDGSRP